MTELTYRPVGATRTGELPPGYRHLRYRMPLGVGVGEDLYRRAGEAVLTFRMHRATGTRMRAAGPLAVVFQWLYARLCGRALRRLCTVNA